MIGLIIISHGNLATELKNSLENVIGPQKNLETVCIGYEDDVDKRQEEVVELITKVDDGQGVILLTEMFGNTPSNLLISLVDNSKVEMIGGINLPLLIKIGSLRDSSDVKGVIKASIEAGHKYIGVASEILSQQDN